MSAQSLVGRVGTVCVGVRGGDRPGEVRVVVEGLPHFYIAFCSQTVPEGRQVLIINSRGSRQLDVEPWEQAGTGIDDVRDPFGRI
jgi:hypothetical protein